MYHDYYAILGIAADADVASIRNAYWQKALKCHPDRGGTHEQMLLLNEAWEILSNPEKRRRYDAAWDQHGSGADREAAEADSRTARQKAEQYPRSWPEFERWLGVVANDFRQAKHSSKRGNFGTHWPHVENSVSGWLFIVCGAVFSYFVLPLFFPLPQSTPGIRVFFLAFPGAWLGAYLHKFIADCMPASIVRPGADAQEAPKPTEAIVACNKCGQRLRLPAISDEIRVTCPSCSFKFDYETGKRA